jgi:hypothetical protein
VAEGEEAVVGCVDDATCFDELLEEDALIYQVVFYNEDVHAVVLCSGVDVFFGSVSSSDFGLVLRTVLGLVCGGSEGFGRA